MPSNMRPANGSTVTAHITPTLNGNGVERLTLSVSDGNTTVSQSFNVTVVPPGPPVIGPIADVTTRPWTIMEVCGGQTHSIVKYGIDRILPRELELVHGPGCPVCVTSLEMIDRAHAIAARPGVIFCSFGDMLRVPGSRGDLLQLKSRGSDIRIVYSPLDAVNLAAAHPDRRVVFFAIGFETTAPPNAMAVWMARKRRLANFSA